jgi:conjugal transfer pilus assembly protein TraI
MLHKWFSKLRRSAPPAPGAAARASQPIQVAAPTGAVRPANPAQPPAYPPVDQGLAIAAPEGLIGANEELLARLRLHAASDPGTFDQRFQQPLMRLAEQVNVLPATASALFSGEGGLFRAALEMGFYSYQAGDGRIFTGAETVERRHALEGRWRYVCFLAGIFYPLGKSLDTIVITSKEGATWRRHFGSLTKWAVDNDVQRIFATWPNVDESQQEIGPSTHTSALIASVVGAENLQWLEDGSPELVKALYEIASGSATQARNCLDVIQTIWERISRREEARRPQAYGRQIVGTHMGPYLVGAIRALLATPDWNLNGEKVKADQSGLYLVWPGAIEDIARFGVQQGYPGWPSSASTIAELLKASQVVTQGGEENLGMVEVIASGGEILMALKVKNPLSVLEDFDPDAYAQQTPKTLSAIIAADPLARAEASIGANEVKAPRGQAKQATLQVEPEAAQEAQVVATTPVQRADQDAQESQQGVQQAAQAEAVDRADPGIEPPTPQPEPQDEVAAAGAVAPIREAAEVRYSDLVPQEVQKDIKKRLHIELLGKVMKAWRDRGEASKSMRMTDNGAAITVEKLATLVRDVPAWVGEMAAAGLIYSPPATPGLKVIKVAIPEGAKPKEAVVLSRFAVKKLGL